MRNKLEHSVRLRGAEIEINGRELADRGEIGQENKINQQKNHVGMIGSRFSCFLKFWIDFRRIFRRILSACF